MKKYNVNITGKRYIVFILFMTFSMIFQADTYQLRDISPDKEKVLRIILGVSSLLTIFIATYTSFLRTRKKINKFQYILLNLIFFSGLLSATVSYTNYSGGVLTFFFFVRNMLIGSLFALVYDWVQRIINEEKIKQEQARSELRALKYQINPHFLFNTLNNIDSLINKEPEKASAMVVELSDIMRYMIYDTRTETVPLHSELEYIKSFIELQKTHYSNPNLVKLEINGNTDNIRIAPMIFISFIENAFKHSTNKDLNEAISFRFEISAESIIFESSNFYDKLACISKDHTSGIGLTNVKKRLELMYSNQHELTIDEKDNLFLVKLTIKLS